MNKTAKEQVLNEYKEIFSNSLLGILINYEGLTVEEITALRKKLHDEKSKLRILKNTIARKAVTGTCYEKITDDLKQTCALIYSQDDYIAPAKIISKFADDFKKIKIISGVLVNQEQGSTLDVQQIKELASLPSREELIVKLLYLFQSPASQFVRTLNEVPAKFVRVLKAYADSKNN